GCCCSTAAPAPRSAHCFPSSLATHLLLPGHHAAGGTAGGVGADYAASCRRGSPTAPGDRRAWHWQKPSARRGDRVGSGARLGGAGRWVPSPCGPGALCPAARGIGVSAACAPTHAAARRAGGLLVARAAAA